MERLIRESDIYFSPFFPLPDEIMVNPSIRQMLIIYDLIPLLFKEEYKIGYTMLKDLFSQIMPHTILFAISEYTKNDILHYTDHVKPKQITVIPLAVNDSFKICYDKNKITKILKKYHIIDGSKYIFSVASADVRKNVDFLFRAFDLLLNPKDPSNRQVPDDLYLVLSGIESGKDRNALQVFENLSETTRQRIIFTGYVDDIDLPFLYSGASCFCFMSLYEGFGLPVLEAMQCGVPVITSNTSSLPEVVGDAGITLDPHDIEGLVNALMQVISNENLRNEMTAKGLEQAKKFSWDRCVDLIVEKIIN